MATNLMVDVNATVPMGWFGKFGPGPQPGPLSLRSTEDFSPLFCPFLPTLFFFRLLGAQRAWPPWLPTLGIQRQHSLGRVLPVASPTNYYDLLPSSPAAESMAHVTRGNPSPVPVRRLRVLIVAALHRSRSAVTSGSRPIELTGGHNARERLIVVDRTSPTSRLVAIGHPQ